MKPLTAYHPRSIRCLGVQSISSWQIKLYAITKDGGEPPSEALLAMAKEVISSFLLRPQPSHWVHGTDWARLPSYGLGFAMVHLGSEAVFLLLDIWVGENMLQHEVWVGPLDGSGSFESISSTGVSVCVWELAVQLHEREAWLRHIYRPDQKPNVAGYLSDQMTADI